MKNPLITIIITTFNRKKMLEKALLSAINQTYKNLEIIVSDNHSEDGTEEYMLDMAQKDKRIRYFRQKENIGLVNNVCDAYTKLQSDYYIILCDDDRLELDYVEKCWNFMESHPDYTFISPRVILYDDNYNEIKKADPVDLESENAAQRIFDYVRKKESDVVTGLFRSDILHDIKEKNGFFLDKNYAEDMILMMRFLIRGKAKVLDTTYYHKLNNGSTRILDKTPKDSFDTTGITYENFYRKLYEIFTGAFQKEPYFREYLTKDDLKKLPDMLYEALLRLKFNVPDLNFRTTLTREFFKEIWRHPFNFLIRKRFWEIVKAFFIRYEL